MKGNKVSEEFCVTGSTSDRGLLPINPSLDVEGPFVSVLATKDRFIDILPFSSDLDPPRA